MAGEVKPLSLIPDVLREMKTLVYSPPPETDYTTSVSPASPFSDLKIAKTSPLIAELPHLKGCSIQISLIRNFVLNTS